MDPSSPYAMARLVELRDRFDVAFGNDADADRHGIVTAGAGLMNPNHFLSAAVAYLFGGGRDWGAGRGGRQDARLERDARPGRRATSVAGCSRSRSGSSGSSPGCSTAARVRWRGERRGLVPAPRRHGLDDRQGRHHRLPAGGRADRQEPGATRARPTRELTDRFGAPVYRRIDAPATPAQKAVLGSAVAGAGVGHRAGRRARDRHPDDRAGQRRRRSAGSRSSPSTAGSRPGHPGTENVYKIYAESFLGDEHLDRIIEEAQAVVGRALA